MKLIAVRHTSVNVPDGMCYGQTDVELSPGFLKEAEIIQKKLHAHVFDALYSSPLKRCTKLAQILAGNLPVVEDKRLAELNFGDWEQQQWNEIYGDPASEAWFNDYIAVPCPNGEAFLDVLQRVGEFLYKMKCSHKDDLVCLVTHAGVIRALHSIINGEEPRATFQRKIEFGEVVEFII